MRRLRTFGAALAALALWASAAAAENAPGVTATEIKIGQTMPYSGPVTAFGTLGQGEFAFFQMINDQGGINGRKVRLISLDDGYVPPRTVEQTRGLVEDERVAFLFSSIGTATNSAVQKYLNDHKIPQLFIGSGAYKWGNYKDYPWTIGGVQASFRVSARIYTRYVLHEQPDAKIGLLYQNDDYGKDFVAGVKDVLGDAYASRVTAQSYEFTDPTIDSQIISLKGAGATAVILAVTPKFAVQAIRRIHDLDWHPIAFLSDTAIWVSTVMEPAGPEKAVGYLSSAYVKDPTDPAWADDAGVKQWRAFMAKYMPGADVRDQNYVNAYNSAMTITQVLKQCGNDLSRENILRQATALHGIELPMLLPGIEVTTGPDNYYPVRQMQLMRWDGKRWVRFGELMSNVGQ